MTTTIAILSIPGREDYTAQTVNQLDGHGGASVCDVRKFLFWTAPNPPPFPLPYGWTLEHNQREREGHRKDQWRLMSIVGNDDLLFFEDDVIACRNAVPYMVNWQHRLLTTFHNLQKQRPGPVLASTLKHGFWGTQAIKLPSAVNARLLAAGDTDKRQACFAKDGGDTLIGRRMRDWGEHIYYHRSLVQHIGERSIHNPGATCTGLRAPVADFDLDFDPTLSIARA